MKRTCKIGQEVVENWDDYCPSDQFKNEKIIACNQQVCRKFSSWIKSQKFRNETLLDVYDFRPSSSVWYRLLKLNGQNGQMMGNARDHVTAVNKY